MKSKMFLLLIVVFSFGAHLFSWEPCCDYRYFLSVGWGNSWSTEAGLEVDTTQWDPSPEGYNARLGSSEMYFIGLGAHVTSWLSLELELSYRPEFKYEKFQTSTASTTPGFIGTKTRRFKLSNWSYLFNVFLNKQGEWFKFNYWCGRCVAPFIGGGIGVGYNTVKDFHSVSPVAAGATNAAVRSIMTAYTETGFAAQFIAGLVSRVTDRLSVEIAYRRFHGGKFRTNDYIVDVPTGFTSPIELPFWKGTLNANEVYLGLNLSI